MARSSKTAEQLPAATRIRRAMGQMHYGAGIVPSGGDMSLEMVADYLEKLQPRLQEAAQRETMMRNRLDTYDRDVEGLRRLFGVNELAIDIARLPKG